MRIPFHSRTCACSSRACWRKCKPFTKPQRIEVPVYLRVNKQLMEIKGRVNEKQWRYRPSGEKTVTEGLLEMVSNVFKPAAAWWALIQGKASCLTYEKQRACRRGSLCRKRRVPLKSKGRKKNAGSFKEIGARKPDVRRKRGPGDFPAV